MTNGCWSLDVRGRCFGEVGEDGELADKIDPIWVAENKKMLDRMNCDVVRYVELAAIFVGSDPFAKSQKEGGEWIPNI